MKLNLNGKSYDVDAEDETPVLWALRDELNLTGTKFGCGKALCGACTVHVNGEAVRSCSYPISAAVDKQITTIEGLDDRVGQTVKKAWVENYVPQCGYCQSGQVMSAAVLLRAAVKAKKRPTDDDIDAAMSGILCRCGTYQRIRAAIHQAAKTLI